MDLTITIGCWLVPVGTTITAFVCAYLFDPQRSPPSGFSDIANGIISLIIYGAAVILSLIAWLVWAVLT